MQVRPVVLLITVGVKTGKLR
ncbi:hypothetical protein [Mycobacterium uberis]